MAEKYITKGLIFMSEKKNESWLLKLLGNTKWKVLFVVLSFIMLGLALLCEYFFYPKNTELWASIFTALFLICIIVVIVPVTLRFFKENKWLILFTNLILFSMAILNSTQISAIVFPLIFELLFKIIFSNSSLKGLEKKIRKFNSENKVKLIVNKNYFEDREKDAQFIFKLIIYFMWILPVLAYDVLKSLAIEVNKITGIDDFNKKIFDFANNIIMKYDKVTLCMTFMMIFMVIFFIFLFCSKRVKEMSDEYVERKNRPFIKNEVKGKEKWRSFFTDDEIVYIDEA